MNLKAVRYQHEANAIPFCSFEGSQVPARGYSVFIIRRRPSNRLRAIRSTCFCIRTWRGFRAGPFFLFSKSNFSIRFGSKADLCEGQCPLYPQKRHQMRRTRRSISRLTISSVTGARAMTVPTFDRARQSRVRSVARRRRPSLRHRLKPVFRAMLVKAFRLRARLRPFDPQHLPVGLVAMNAG